MTENEGPVRPTDDSNKSRNHESDQWETVGVKLPGDLRSITPEHGDRDGQFDVLHKLILGASDGTTPVCLKLVQAIILGKVQMNQLHPATAAKVEALLDRLRAEQTPRHAKMLDLRLRTHSFLSIATIVGVRQDHLGEHLIERVLRRIAADARDLGLAGEPLDS